MTMEMYRNWKGRYRRRPTRRRVANSRTRCPHAIDICRVEEPKLDKLGFEHDVACHRWKELAE